MTCHLQISETTIDADFLSELLSLEVYFIKYVYTIPCWADLFCVYLEVWSFVLKCSSLSSFTFSKLVSFPRIQFHSEVQISGSVSVINIPLGQRILNFLQASFIYTNMNMNVLFLLRGQ